MGALDDLLNQSSAKPTPALAKPQQGGALDSLLAGTAEQEAGPIVSPTGLAHKLKPRPEDIPEMLAGTAAGLKFAASKTPVGIAAVGGASALANLGVQGYQKLTGSPKAPQTLKESAGRAGKAALFGVLGEGVGRAAGKLLTPFAGSVTPELNAARTIAEKEGIEAPVSNLVNNRAVQMTERALEYSPFGGAITKQKIKAIEQFKNMTGRIGENIGANTDPAITGSLLKEQTLAYKEAYDQAKDKLYDAVMPQVSKLPADLGDTLTTLKNIVERRSGVAEPAGLKQIKGWIEQIEQGQIKTFADLRKFRTNIGARGKFQDPALSGLDADMSNLYASVSKGLDKTAALAGEEIAAGLKQADEFYAIGKNTLKSKVYKALVNAPQDRMHAIAFNPKSPIQYDLVKEVVGKDSMKDIGGQWFNEIIKENAKRNAGLPSPKVLLNDFEKYKGTIDRLAQDFPEIGAEFGKLKQVAQLLATGREVAMGSQTAPAAIGLGGVYASLVTAIGQLMTGNVKGSAATAGTAIGVSGLSGLGVAGLKSKTGRELLTRGFPKAGKAVSRVAQPITQYGAKALQRQPKDERGIIDYKRP